jgi:hypothetical protein
MHGEILEISCCSITVKSDISGGDGLGSILLSSEYNCINIPKNEIPNPPPLSNDSHFNKEMDCIRKFES